MKTFSLKKKQIKRNWYIIDASNKILGRFLSRVVIILMGKNKSEYSPHLDNGDYVIIVNAEKILVTGKKFKEKKYYRHSGYPGGLKSIYFFQLKKKNPEHIIRLAVKGMLPKNSLGRSIIKKLKIYLGLKHPHQAQNPKYIDI
ncbi:50S ribosomal protein L13 [Candidatus Legionella polyplacis]|uniref:Large ribosomal subunit protein uL13 n=1 Tax=Candidatus Legionella polyplacis TaxID=2005262 RepID=A0ABZ2GVH5_9GAMM|nr:50S ribosomal protein L13 [Candidatus Legionella polyplacis]ATW01978.1 50S ribosomal protein L13 [Candidatus Legionella polyplacis]